MHLPVAWSGRSYSFLSYMDFFPVNTRKSFSGKLGEVMGGCKVVCKLVEGRLPKKEKAKK